VTDRTWMDHDTTKEWTMNPNPMLTTVALILSIIALLVYLIHAI
jgi:hypothetical protein